MKLAHYLAARVLCSKTDAEKTSSALKELLSSGNSHSEIPVTESPGEEPTQLVLLSSFLKKESDINHLLKYIIKNISAKDRELIADEAEMRVDDHLDFFIRLDKEAWILGRKIILTTLGDCFHLTISLAAFPKRKDRAVALVRQIFKTG